MNCGDRCRESLGIRPLAKILELPLPNPPLVKGRGQDFKFPPFIRAMVYTQVIESLPVLELPHPNPPLVKGRELDFRLPPFIRGD